MPPMAWPCREELVPWPECSNVFFLLSVVAVKALGRVQVLVHAILTWYVVHTWHLHLDGVGGRLSNDR